MRVLLVNKFLSPRGGAERAVLALGAALEARGHEVFWFGMQDPDNAVTGERVAVVRPRDYHAPGFRRFRDAADMIYSVEARRLLSRFMARKRPDIVHVHNIYHQLTASVLDAARDENVPVVMTVHDYKLVCPRYDLLRHGHLCDACIEDGPQACVRYRCAGSWLRSAWLTTEFLFHRMRRSYDGIRCFLTPSRFLMGVLRRAGIDAARLRHVPNFAAAAANPGAPSKSGTFVYAGRLSPEKGLRTLLRAVSRVDGGRLILCGRGPMEEELRRCAALLPEGRVVLRGHLPATALWRQMSSCDFTVLPSECFENAPLALLESMALGRACIASRIGGVPELVEEGRTGRLVPPGNVEAWSETLRWALEHPAPIRVMGMEARQVAQQRYQLEQHVGSVEQVYAEVLP